jgi:hypothetical protein
MDATGQFRSSFTTLAFQTKPFLSYSEAADLP